MGNYELPKKYFLRWLKNKIEDKKIKIEFHHFQKAHKDDKLSMFITREEIKKWSKETPVFLSAQTGSGKTWLIKKVLARLVNDKNLDKGKENKILYIANRTALLRQVKHEEAASEVKITGATEHKRELDVIYSEEGADEKRDFDLVDIESYQSIKSRKINKKYKYIICDECHFFTSDSSFNENTDSILKYIVEHGQNAVRIYMSATPEVAFEAITRQEYEFVKETKKAVLSDKQLKINFYNMERDYDYISVNTDKVMNGLQKMIAEDDQKWIIFVSSKTAGEKLEKYFNGEEESSSNQDGSSNDDTASEGINDNKSKTSKDNKKEIPKAVFISAANKSEGIAKAVFNEIAKFGTFGCQYLICTSVLDNGVSIEPEGIRGVIIDKIFDRVEILQMIGRIRRPSSLEVYITPSDISGHYSKDLKTLLAVLNYDRQDKRTKENVHKLEDMVKKYIWEQPNRLFFKEDGEKRYKYNKCSIYHLIDRLLLLRRFLNKDPEFSTMIEGLIAKLYTYYRHGGKDMSWSRNIVDLIEADEDRMIRAQEKRQKIDKGKLKDKDSSFNYTYEEDSTFYNYIYTDLIPNFYAKKIKDGMKSLLGEKAYKALKGRVKHEIGKADVDSPRYLEIAEELCQENGISADFKFEKKYLKEMRRYNEFGLNNHFPTIVEEIYRWFEKPYTPLEILSDSHIESSEQSEDYFKKYVLADERFIDEDPEWEYVEAHALRKNAIGQAGKTDKNVLTKEYSELVKLLKVKDIKKSTVINLCNTKYVVDSYRKETDNTRPTFYFLISLDEKWKPYRERRGLKTDA